MKGARIYVKIKRRLSVAVHTRDKLIIKPPKSFPKRKDITMKTICRLAVLALTVALLLGALAFYSGAEGAATISDTPTATTIDGIHSYAHALTGNYATSGLNNGALYDLDFGYTGYTVTRADGSNYIELVSNAEQNADKHFQFTPYANELVSYDSSKHQYGVFDFDIATETDLTYLSIVSNMRKGSSTSDHTYTDGAVNIYFNSLFTAKRDRFMHVTVIEDITAKMQYIYIDNVMVHSTNMMDNDSYTAWTNGEVKLWPSFKLQMHQSYTHIPPLTENQTILIDNLQYHYFSYSTSGDALAPLLSTGIGSWSDRVYNDSYKMPIIPDVAIIDGKSYNNIYDANAKLSDESPKAKEVTLLRTTKVPIVVGCNATVTSNGHPFELGQGYGQDEISSGVYQVDNAKKIVTVKINGNEVCTKEIARGTALGSIFGDETMGKTVIFGNGRLYKNVSWNDVDWETNVTKNVEISGTGTEVTTYVAHNGTSIISTASFSAALTDKTAPYVILGSDYTLTAANVAIKCKKNIYLNDHTLTQEKGSNHSFTGNNLSRITFNGPGVINSMSPENTYGLVFAQMGYSSSVYEFNNLTINSAYHLAVMRDGTVRFNNCECNVFSALNSNVFMMGEGSMNTVTVELNETTINFTHDGDKNIPVFRQYEEDSTLTHKINVNNSTIVAESVIFDLAAANNMAVNVSNSSLIAESLVPTDKASTAEYGQINFLNSVNVNNSMQNLGKVDTSALTRVKSNNHLAPVCYSDNYATVTWWTDNSVEYWADGSTPVKDGAFIPVHKVTGGQSYTFDNPYKKAPFSLKGNLTLTSEISFNLYVTEGTVDCVRANGKTVYATQKVINSVTYDTFTVKLTPSEAASAFDVFFTLKDGNTVARTISVAAYADAAIRATDNAAARNIVVATLEYIKASALYFGINADFTDINAVIDAAPIIKPEIPTDVTNVNTGDISSYFTGAQLDLSDTLKMRFNIKSGANITSLSVQVNSREVDYTVYASYVELNLRAYELSDLITINVNGIKKDYSLVEYLISAKSLSSGTTVSAKQCAELFKDVKGNLASAIYNYSIAARAYKPVL